jgi:hypothetical protein
MRSAWAASHGRSIAIMARFAPVDSAAAFSLTLRSSVNQESSGRAGSMPYFGTSAWTSGAIAGTSFQNSSANAAIASIAGADHGCGVGRDPPKR